MDEDVEQFLAAMAKSADATTHELEIEEAALRALIGGARAEELELLWTQQLDPADEEDIKRYMDWNDKKLIWIWRRLERSRERRVAAGRAYMINSQGTAAPAISAPAKAGARPRKPL
ncbi:hypothetical protein Msil_1269 [Methylocella silvestris BL2]|uniref:Uncharacterized protein n=2 Tax=Methylocella silvestris TaxID=199596 RepID=B8EPN3_METSB|nr:hypothetical protein [Methylocella silvestris]ACK50238.1 hypothetical protein Msil_1269 [Methylocella silvestris BL2]CAJ26298.1 hypothetical protein [Methylocella silvestris BL2]